MPTNRFPMTLHALIIACCLLCSVAIAQETEELLQSSAPKLDILQEQYNQGLYEEAAEYAKRGQEFDPWNGEWEVIKSKSLVATGRYEEAYQSLQTFVADRVYELRARLLLYDVSLLNGLDEEARRQKDTLGYLVNERANRYSYNPASIAAVGDIALLFDVEPKLVLENFYRRAQSYGSQPLSAFLGIGRLALSKDDFKLASKTYQEGLQVYPENVELWHGLASSYREGDRSKLIEYAEKALTINPRHAPSRILIAEHLLAAEAYDAASEQLDTVLQTNPKDFKALALKSALSYIRNQNDTGDELRTAALTPWNTNPQVDYIIGKQLSRKYRFTDGASHQRIALSLDETFDPARLQLAQDLLRLARNKEAWPLAHTVYQADPYNISAYNLVTLHDNLDDFTTVDSENFHIHLRQDEAKVYGERALRVLESAHQRLSERYQVELPQKTTVEIYAEPADFETRTFGVPGNPGYLGVCFGPVFTINSPATRSSNWEAVLYHEFCHTITLHLSQNRMPRWLSEGISVYEEQLENPSWGQRMSASYRDRILSGRMQPISSMSSAFLEAEDGEDIQFAYYQSYLVVEYLVQNYGMEKIRDLLVSLGEGTEMNDCLALHLAPIEALDEGFSAFAREQAEALAPGYEFAAPTGLMASIKSQLNDTKEYQPVLQRGLDLLAEENWEATIETLQELVDEVGYLPAPENAHWTLAQAYRGNEDQQNEKRILEEMYQHESNRLGPISRLHEIATTADSQPDLLKWSNAWIAINPMAKTPWRTLLSSASSTGNSGLAIESAKALLALETPDSASLNYQIAVLLQSSDLESAKRHLMMSLEEAPRFRKAYALYDEINEKLALQEKEQNLEGLELDYDFLK
ncbi:peptidase MA family metallohydrolase [Pelagicoccus mobilis]|uniref:Peptidase MA-like domain-containing protein n=1 Tax=Pelagicoccus mobilis TaxID=415221 RepID=A0A934VR09_9BACT|nr:peptidase MA family metallohydrolase [Pelagicoccus mobilis]MBK1877054.1 hypothetical protein [Pelagicoccus mobilis]